ncbi:MAG: multicopper oxidase domain-containing protein [Acidobacteriota bacterium]
MKNQTEKPLSRREWLRRGALGTATVAAGSAALASLRQSALGEPTAAASHSAMHDHSQMSVVGDIRPGGFDPTAFLTHFDYGTVSKTADGQTVREYHMAAMDKEIEVAPGVFFPAWTYNGQVPGPTIRCVQGDRLRVHFHNAGSHPHTIHFHGFHPANMDGVFEIVQPGDNFVYDFTAEPFGLHLYHCHTIPLKRHIHKGLYGAFIIDPKQGRPPAQELVMVMNGFDTDFNSENEFYAVNTVAFHYQKHPIQLVKGEKVRAYVVNALEFDLVNSIHLHANFFQLYRTGTSLTSSELADTVMFCQGERHILEFQYDFPGQFMFHAHQSEFAELGWMGLFEVSEPRG